MEARGGQAPLPGERSLWTVPLNSRDLLSKRYVFVLCKLRLREQMCALWLRNPATSRTHRPCPAWERNRAKFGCSHKAVVQSSSPPAPGQPATQNPCGVPGPPREYVGGPVSRQHTHRAPALGGNANTAVQLVAPRSMQVNESSATQKADGLPQRSDNADLLSFCSARPCSCVQNPLLPLCRPGLYPHFRLPTQPR